MEVISCLPFMRIILIIIAIPTAAIAAVNVRNVIGINGFIIRKLIFNIIFKNVDIKSSSINIRIIRTWCFWRIRDIIIIEGADNNIILIDIRKFQLAVYKTDA
jgi:hypothetical protein